MFDNIYQGKVILITGHTGFKGSWLAAWLHLLGAEVIGYSLPPQGDDAHYKILRLPLVSYESNILDSQSLFKVFEQHKTSLVFHLAAQPLVRQSYREPTITFESNILGTVNVYEAVRQSSYTTGIISITTDKVYENKEWPWGYRETDTLGGHDPYSTSKACVELISDSYRKSFFSEKKILLATARAGNVIGGGDWNEERLVPDLMKAAIRGERAFIRNPYAIRPWQHVLECLYGYLQLGQKILEGNEAFATSWNFAPDAHQALTVHTVASLLKKAWDKVAFDLGTETGAFHEAGILKLDNSKAKSLLGWKPVWSMEQTISHTSEWYKAWFEEKKVITISQIEAFCDAVSR
jgi:CDP-glucose 4,6-dehydratase